jgi:hypothetical protein
MARKKSLTDVWVSLGTRIKLDTSKRFDDYCIKNPNLVKGALVDQAIIDLLDKLEKK